MAKDRHQKTALEMDFNEFVSWATSRVLFGIGEGERLRDIMHSIIDHAARNTVFGGGKQAE
jgi:hypothetical protein